VSSPRLTDLRSRISLSFLGFKTRISSDLSVVGLINYLFKHSHTHTHTYTPYHFLVFFPIPYWFWLELGIWNWIFVRFGYTYKWTALRTFKTNHLPSLTFFLCSSLSLIGRTKPILYHLLLTTLSKKVVLSFLSFYCIIVEYGKIWGLGYEMMIAGLRRGAVREHNNYVSWERKGTVSGSSLKLSQLPVSINIRRECS
jgi:hypothetical protein